MQPLLSLREFPITVPRFPITLDTFFSLFFFKTHDVTLFSAEEKIAIREEGLISPRLRCIAI